VEWRPRSRRPGDPKSFRALPFRFCSPTDTGVRPTAARYPPLIPHNLREVTLLRGPAWENDLLSRSPLWGSPPGRIMGGDRIASADLAPTISVAFRPEAGALPTYPVDPSSSTDRRERSRSFRPLESRVSTMSTGAERPLVAALRHELNAPPRPLVLVRAAGHRAGRPGPHRPGLGRDRLAGRGRALACGTEDRGVDCLAVILF
jgi:hypothetical protein